MFGSIRRIGLSSGAAALIVALAGSAYVSSQHVSAQGPGGRFDRGGPRGPMDGPRPLGPMMLNRLGLSDTQRDQVKQIVDSHRDEQKALNDRGRTARETLDEVTATGTFDESTARARAADLAAVDADMAVARARIYSDVFQVLTKAQQDQLVKMQADMKARRDKMAQGHRPPRGDRR
jgi:protein CpxP